MYIFSPSQVWPHQQTPSSLMMQVPVQQHLGSSVMGAPLVKAGLAIGSSVICNLSVIELHGWVSQSAMLGCSARNPLSPYAVRPGL